MVFLGTNIVNTFQRKYIVIFSLSLDILGSWTILGFLLLCGVNNRTRSPNLLSHSCFPSSAPGGDTVPAVSASGHAGSGGGVANGGSSRSAPRSQGPVEKDEGGNQKRARRQWESWSTEDKNSFFEGLYEVINYSPGCKIHKVLLKHRNLFVLCIMSVLILISLLILHYRYVKGKICRCAVK